LYQRLVLKEQKVDLVGVSFGDKADPELFTVQARLKKEEDMAYVREQILATFRRYTTELIPQQKLDDTRSRRRYGFAQAMDSSEAIAGALAPYLALRRTPETMNKLFSLADSVTPADIRDAARRYFTDNNRTIVTLSQGAGKQTANREGGK
jgi:zinc protease